MKKPMTMLLAAGAMLGAMAETIDLSSLIGDRTFVDGDVITGTLPSTKKYKLSIADKATVILRNARIDGTNCKEDPLCPWAGLTCLGDAEIRIDGTNYVKGFYKYYPGIYVPANKTLTIRQDYTHPEHTIGVLGGGMLEAYDNGQAAGIGASYEDSCGNVVIESGIIKAYGHNAAGIGGGKNSSCGNITIKRGVVFAEGGSKCAAIGGSEGNGCGAITIEDRVTLVVAKVRGTCENHIGAGKNGTCGAVTVTLAEGATDTTNDAFPPTRTIEGRVGAAQYANGLVWKFRIVDGEAEICDYVGYNIYGKEDYNPAIDQDYAGALAIPDTLGFLPVTRIGNRAIVYCKKITSATIPATVTSIGKESFQYCEKLASVTIPSSVTTIGERAFESCDGLTGLTIMDGVTAIEERAFAGCDSLASLTIPGSVKRIGTAAFSSCDGLTSLTIMDGVETIGEEAFGWCDGLASVTIPGSVKRIGDSAFKWCDNLASVTVMNGVETIGESAFERCACLTSIDIPASVKTVGEQAFSDCTSLTTVNGLSEDVTVGDGAFVGCIALADENGFVIVNNVLYMYAGGEANVTVPAGVTRVGAMSFMYHTSNPLFGEFPPLVSVTLPDSVTSIGMSAFAFCTDLEKVTFPAKMPSVEVSAFLLCVKLADAKGFVTIGGPLHMYMGTSADVTIPHGVTCIGPMAFVAYTGAPPYYFWISSVTSMTIPSSVTDIYSEAFCYCPLLTTVSIPSSVTNIGEGAFCEMTGNTFPLQIVHVEAGDTERVKGLVLASGHPVDGITFIEDYKPVHSPTCYTMLDEADVTAPYGAPQAVTLVGAAYDDCDVVGIVELKLGKVNVKKGSSKVSGSVTTLDGKKHSAKGVNVTGIDGTTPATVSLEVKGLGAMVVTIGGTQFAGTLGGTYHVQSADVGGAWAGGSAVAEVEAGDLSMFSGRVLADFLPVNEVAAVSGGKWKFGKAASVKWGKPKKGAAFPEIYDAASGKGLLVDTAKGANLSGLKLTYTPKKGTFKGSFNVYALEGAGSATKLKKYKVNVTGVVVGGVGYGEAACKKPAVSWPLTVE